ncbi:MULTISPECIES: hypothetical protein [Haloferax]|uniref:Uncharacterized protein n=1 Tax=Haloferax marinum TaxID=2666143 RepID=A0A6A8G817_9EURY|nr:MULTISPECIES: hypothetical protein [Haloferax]KAB1197951.1 hypothetical protein Hfx1150_10645 [Haloferax sp. CBA1150]MRW97017.1 hypothetical protein [Haloferax marinum]
MLRQNPLTDADIDFEPPATYREHLAILEELYADLHGASHPLIAAREPYSQTDISLGDLFPTAVINTHSEHEDWEGVTEAGPYNSSTVNNKYSVASMPQEALDELVTTETEFESAATLIDAAIDFHLAVDE